MYVCIKSLTCLASLFSLQSPMLPLFNSHFFSVLVLSSLSLFLFFSLFSLFLFSLFYSYFFFLTTKPQGKREKKKEERRRINGNGKGNHTPLQTLQTRQILQTFNTNHTPHTCYACYAYSNAYLSAHANAYTITTTQAHQGRLLSIILTHLLKISYMSEIACSEGNFPYFRAKYRLIFSIVKWSSTSLSHLPMRVESIPIFSLLSIKIVPPNTILHYHYYYITHSTLPKSKLLATFWYMVLSD